MEIAAIPRGSAWPESDDGIHFTRRAEPCVLSRERQSSSTRVSARRRRSALWSAKTEPTFLTYTQWNRKTTLWVFASSRDLSTDETRPAFLHASGAVRRPEVQVGRNGDAPRSGERATHAAKINGKYTGCTGAKAQFILPLQPISFIGSRRRCAGQSD